MKSVLSLFFILLSTTIYAKDYSDYHRAINKAEEHIFIHSKIDSGINLYSKIFKEFDFVYAGDCLIAIQIALYANNEKAFLNFTEKAFQNGLMLRNFKKVYYKSPCILLKRYRKIYTALQSQSASLSGKN